MTARIRRFLETVRNVMSFGRAHPDPSAGFTAAQTALETGLDRAEALATQQRNGGIIEGSANGRKKRYRFKVVLPALNHLIRVAEVASREVPGLSRSFQLPDDDSYFAFRTAAGAMAEAARANLDLLVRHGLVESLLTSLEQTLALMDQASAEESDGRRSHVGASADLEVVAQELMKVVKVMDGLNRFRFAEDAEKLAAWVSASNVVTPSRAAPPASSSGGDSTPPVAGQITPAPKPAATTSNPQVA